MRARLDVAGQFGGRDAAAAALPHFRALKVAAKVCDVRDFPVPDLTFILRISGDIHAYETSGSENVDVDRSGEYVSIDICCTRADRDDLETVIEDAIQATPTALRAHGGERLSAIDFESLAQDLAAFVERYRDALAST